MATRLTFWVHMYVIQYIHCCILLLFLGFFFAREFHYLLFSNRIFSRRWNYILCLWLHHMYYAVFCEQHAVPLQISVRLVICWAYVAASVYSTVNLFPRCVILGWKSVLCQREACLNSGNVSAVKVCMIAAMSLLHVSVIK